MVCTRVLRKHPTPTPAIDVRDFRMAFNRHVAVEGTTHASVETVAIVAGRGR